MNTTRRYLLAGMGAALVSAGFSTPALARSGWLNANSLGLRSGSPDDQGTTLQSILQSASEQRLPVFIEPGEYRLSGVSFPDFVHLEGAGAATRIRHTGNGAFITATGSSNISLSGIVFDGGLLPLSEDAPAALSLRSVSRLEIRKCHVTNSSGVGMELNGCEGLVSQSRIDGCVGEAGLICQNGNGMEIISNLVENCANNGILVHRYAQAEDNTVVANNRVRHISAINGGTGPWGNGINTYLANGVRIANNHVSDCAFSAIRSNSCSNIAIDSNTCLRSGETAIYSEFAFQGAVITDNIVDGAATGISIANANEGGRLSVCSGNLVRNLKLEIPYEDPDHERGIGIYAEVDTVVNANVVENSPRFGIQLGWGPYLRNVVASSNVVSKAETGIGISVVDGIGEVRIDNNMLSGITKHSIAGYHWHDRVTGELAGGQPLPLSQLSISGNRTGS